MKNQITNDAKENLTPAIIGSYMLPFALEFQAEFQNLKIFFALLNGQLNKMVIKKIYINVTARNLNDRLPQILVVNRCVAADLVNGNDLQIVKKNSQYPNSGIAKAKYTETFTDGISIVDRDNVAPLAHVIYFRDQSMVKNDFLYQPNKSFDFKDHIILNKGEGIYITKYDRNDQGISDQDGISGVIEWDEIAIED